MNNANWIYCLPAVSTAVTVDEVTVFISMLVLSTL